MLGKAIKRNDKIGNVATIFEKLNISKINPILISAASIRHSFNFKIKSPY